MSSRLMHQVARSAQLKGVTRRQVPAPLAPQRLLPGILTLQAGKSAWSLPAHLTCSAQVKGLPC